MRKIILTILCVLTITFFYSCNEIKDKTSELPKKDSSASIMPIKKLVTLEMGCEGVANFAIDETEAKEMINRFETIYRKKGTPNEVNFLASSVWVDEMVINSLGAFLESNNGSSYDGARFVNGTSSDRTESTLLIVPTNPKTGDNKRHIDDWGNGKFSLLTGDPIKFTNFNMRKNQADPLINNFERIYRNGTTTPPSLNLNPLSSAVWINKCVFIALSRLIENSDNEIDGLRVYFAAYKDMTTYRVPGQFHSNQSTIILVPTSSDGNGGHSDRWDIIPSRTSYAKDAGYNHGALCPNQCN